MNFKRKNVRGGSFENVDKAIYTWFVSKRSQKIPIDGAILKEKALEFAKALNETEFKASDCWLSNWKKRSVNIFHLLFYWIRKGYRNYKKDK